MLIPELTPLQWTLGAAAGMLVGFSKTGVPGAGILVVPLMAGIFGGRESVGTLLPMLIFADCFAVLWYRQHTQWDKLWRLIPWVIAGMGLGALLLYYLGEQDGTRDYLGLIIGVLVLIMLGVHLARQQWGQKLVPHSHMAAIFTGGAAGFATAVSNAAGPIMTIYFQSMGLNKQQFMGSFAWYFLIFNTTKVPIYAALTYLNPDRPMFSAQSLTFDLMVAPMIVVGAFAGKWLLPKIPQNVFNSVLLILAAVAAIRLVLG